VGPVSMTARRILQRIRRPVIGRWWERALTCVVLLAVTAPTLANKFETIGGGVSGSVGVKRESLLTFFLVTGGISLLGALLAVAVPHKNALYLNFSNWKQSAILLFVVACGFFSAAALI